MHAVAENDETICVVRLHVLVEFSVGSLLSTNIPLVQSPWSCLCLSSGNETIGDVTYENSMIEHVGPKSGCIVKHWLILM